MLHLETKWPSKQNILIADTILAEPALSQVLRFVGKDRFFGGTDFCFYHTFKANFSEHKKSGRAPKRFGVTAPECLTPCLGAWEKTSPESLPLEAFMFV